MDKLESDGARSTPSRALDGDLCRQAEKLGQLLSELFNENTALRERVRVLESEMQRASRSV
jgi:hypothetical protein